MWFLSTSRAELKHFITPESVGGYAILSHVWNEAEQSHQDIQALGTLCAQTGQNPRDLASDKIRRCCELAERHGYLWVWIDTCCINKTSSAELSEAINSMFRYYSLATVCYAYLEDVPGTCKLDTRAPSFKFRRSRWHLRGWTLQELVAPRLVLFISQSWDVLGSKTDLATVLENTTGIPATVLRFQQSVADISIAQRMSWAAFRTATRVEDEAYCLMGIFGVNMPTLYGEGRAAFQRLQEVILRRFTDTTLFAWGLSREVTQLRNIYYRGAVDRPTTLLHDPEHADGSSIFATSPAAFADSRQITYVPGSLPIGDHHDAVEGVPTFSVTPHGVHAHVRVIGYDGVAIVDLSWRAHGDVPIGLVLTPCPLSADPTRPLYDVGAPDRPFGYVRLARLPTRGRVRGEKLPFSSSSSSSGSSSMSEDGHWRDICLAHRPTRQGLPANSGRHILVDTGFSAPFRFRQLRGDVLISPSNIDLHAVTELPLPWTGSVPMVLSLVKRPWYTIGPSLTRGLHSDSGPGFHCVLILGRCTGLHPHACAGNGDPRVHLNTSTEPALGSHWATVHFSCF
ncbi:HET-domain-containing protein [Polyporus arcularius HHB13444]|uniref:HET-domain-containing protein n=1 Tax=Polyporus arcularius HHB13444 TaxID=1314778 RepID=A0A5C3P4F7_9APHY|nr:HET-domain-containing protein [Polyporus arcularius HHB13444]